MTKNRTRPIVSPAAVRRWARAAGIPVPDGPLDEQTVDRYLGRASLVTEPEGVPGFGPPPCPDCGQAGYLEHIDLVRQSQSNRCRTCGCRWTTALVTV